MHTHVKAWILLGICPLLAAGCNSQASSSNTSQPAVSHANDNGSAAPKNGQQTPAETKEPAATNPEQPAAAEEPKTVETPPEELKPAMPAVELSQDHAATCLVKVGDKLPDFRLADLSGAQHSLTNLRGKQATVVLYWTTKNLYGPDAIAEMEKIKSEYADRGVSVLAVCRGGVADEMKPIIDEAQTSYPQLLDPDAAAYGKVATKLVPRTYLLDAEGKIVWFALTYDQRTPKTLRQGLDFMLGEGK